MKKEDITGLFDVTGKVAIITGGAGGFYRHVDPAFIQGLGLDNRINYICGRWLYGYIAIMLRGINSIHLDL